MKCRYEVPTGIVSDMHMHGNMQSGISLRADKLNIVRATARHMCAYIHSM